MRELDNREIGTLSGGVAVGAVLGGVPSGVVHGAATTNFYQHPISGAICYQSVYDYRTVMFCTSFE